MGRGFACSGGCLINRRAGTSTTTHAPRARLYAPPPQIADALMVGKRGRERGHPSGEAPYLSGAQEPTFTTDIPHSTLFCPSTNCIRRKAGLKIP